MLRISSEDDRAVHEFHDVNPRAKETGFGRIFRSPTLFEDIVKTILLCYSSWPRSLEMAEALCSLQHKVLCCGSRKKRKHCDCSGNFPSPNEIASLDFETIKRHCNLGMRVSTILELARDIQNGTLNLDDISPPIIDPPQIHARLMKIKGFGSFVVANIMMCLGIYQYIPIDTETIKHLEQVHGKKKIKGRKAQQEVVAQIYDEFAPYQCLTYW
ncbi:hypothetical protein SASPL_129852 [Salvia splendens]|uniref:HhH-GPD domain-containing protein n=1 Tax=Salvia splendens TaxID=180675 RepID=A0A8X8XGV8_SALSN|nr:hypothetical protein SASPL_129849 [Salvia splendens]KAG6411768.1 hypothetical protein SASPL_129852 [Salvia splendens]